MASICIHPRSLAILVGLLACAAPGQAQKPTVLLQPEFKPGKASYIELVQNMDTALVGGQFGTGLDVKVHQIYGVMQRVERRRRRGNTRLTLTFDRLSMAFDSVLNSASFDSDVDDPKESNHVLAAIYGAMVGMSMHLEIGPDGRARSFSGMSAILKKVDQAARGDPIFEHMVQNGFFDDNVARVRWGEARFALFPYRRVGVGDTWTSIVREPSSFGELISDYNCELTGIAEQRKGVTAEVSFEGTIRAFDDNATAPGPMGSILKFRSGRFTGTAVFDSAAGEFVRQDTRSLFRFDLVLPDGAGATSGNLQITQDITSTLQVMTVAERRTQKARAGLTEKSRER